MRYLYVDEQGNQVELSFPIGQAPEETEHDGVSYRRDIMGEYDSKSFILAGSGWPGQDQKRKVQMTRKNVAAGKRSRDTWGDPKKCTPNYKGEVTENWTEAKNLAEKDQKKS